MNKLRLLAVLFIFILAPTINAATCGPSGHWIDSCTAGIDVIGSSLVEFGIDLDFDGIAEFDAQFVGGPVTINRSNPLDDSAIFPGLAPIDGHNDVIDTEIVSMSLTGVGASLGWTLRAGTGSNVSSVPSHPGPRSSPGAIAEDPSDPSVADSFFDVFFEIDATPFDRLHNDTALRISTIIDRVVPEVGTDYAINGVPGFETTLFPLPLFDDNEIVVAQLVDLTTGSSGHHLITPIPAAVWLFGSGLLGLVGIARRKKA